MKLAGLKSVENAHDDSVWAATWVPATDDRPALLLTGSLDETVRLWRPDDLTSVATSTGHSLGVVSVAAHPSGVIAASASLDSFVRVFDVDHNNTIATLEAPPSEVWQMQFDPKVYLMQCCERRTPRRKAQRGATVAPAGTQGEAT
ncbi:WD repeat-containing protein VIP3-like isoform X2 [Camellia sinensis]|uniref:WD repeat-containing protein VIP3-like isoform X2 n=1 Tax=Camellia sinensis TaxID=4442 RepID=UPI001036E628|nr:WD repeat-containing protein VIP3-like isoform X2 [Camellia sinensis]